METPMHFIYLDNNASTPTDKRVLAEMLPFFTNIFANPNSKHNVGLTVQDVIKKSRIQVANLISADQKEIIFTSGSTESINIAMKGIAGSCSYKGKHIVTVATEHFAVIETCKFLEQIGHEVTYLPVMKDGLIDLNILKQAVRSDTILVCVMHINNETGVIQSIKEIASIAHEAGAFFMTDATQAVGKIEIDVNDLGIDLLSISGHKMYAPKGIGALYVRQNTRPVKLATYTHGGGQEHNLRSGTLNVPGIVALGKACEISKQEMKEDAVRIKILRDRLESELLKINGTIVNGDITNRIYNTTNICFQGHDASVLIGQIGNIAVSTSSACSSKLQQPSHVLKSMGLSDDDAFASIRFSLGRFNTLEQVEILCRTFTNLLTQ